MHKPSSNMETCLNHHTDWVSPTVDTSKPDAKKGERDSHAGSAMAAPTHLISAVDLHDLLLCFGGLVLIRVPTYKQTEC